MIKKKAVLVMRPGRMGDFLVALPAMAAVRRKHEKIPIVLLTLLSSNPATAQNARIYAGTGVPPWTEWFRGVLFDEVIVIDDWKSIRAWRSLRRKLEHFEFQETFLFSYHGETAMRRGQKWLWIRSLGVAGRIHAKSALAEDIRPQGISLHTWASLGVSFRGGARFPEASGLPAPNLGVDAELFAERFWAEHKLAGRQVVVIFPSGTYAHKIWSTANFAKVSTQLQAGGIDVVLIGSAHDAAVSTAVRSQVLHDRSLDLTGATSLSELAAVLRRCALFVGNDGGPAHLAAMMGVRCVTLMSGVHREGMWDPLGAQNIAVRFKTACYDCQSEFSCPAGTRACIDGIEVADVIAACKQQLGMAGALRSS